MPWSLSDARTTLLTSAAGSVLLGWAWWGSSGTGKLDRQTNWAAVGVLAVFLIAFGSFMWMTSARRAVRRRRDALVTRIAVSDLLGEPRMGGVETRRLVALDGSSRYHRETCSLVRGKRVNQVNSEQQTRQRADRPLRVKARSVRTIDELRPCEMCEP